MLFENTMTHAYASSILTGFDINFLENAWGFNNRVTLREMDYSEMFKIVFKKYTVL